MNVKMNDRMSSPTFGKFLKISGEKEKLKSFRNELRGKSDDFSAFIRKKNDKSAEMYVFSGKDYDKLLDLMEKVQLFIAIRLNPEKFMKKKPKKYDLKEARLLFKKNKIL